MLQSTSHTCFDPRDKVFAFRGPFNQSGLSESVFQPNYRIKAIDVHKQLAAGLLSHDKNLDILSVPRAESDSKIPDLPTWVPH